MGVIVPLVMSFPLSLVKYVPPHPAHPATIRRMVTVAAASAAFRPAPRRPAARAVPRHPVRVEHRARVEHVLARVVGVVRAGEVVEINTIPETGVGADDGRGVRW